MERFQCFVVLCWFEALVFLYHMNYQRFVTKAKSLNEREGGRSLLSLWAQWMIIRVFLRLKQLLSSRKRKVKPKELSPTQTGYLTNFLRREDNSALWSTSSKLSSTALTHLDCKSFVIRFDPTHVYFIMFTFILKSLINS